MRKDLKHKLHCLSVLQGYSLEAISVCLIWRKVIIMRSDILRHYTGCDKRKWGNKVFYSPFSESYWTWHTEENTVDETI